VVSLCKCKLSRQDPLELSAGGPSGVLVGTRLTRELARAVERDRDLVCDGGHEQQVRGPEDTRHLRADSEHTDHPALDPQLGAERVPSVTETALDARLRAPDGGDRGLDMPACPP